MIGFEPKHHLSYSEKKRLAAFATYHLLDRDRGLRAHCMLLHTQDG